MAGRKPKKSPLPETSAVADRLHSTAIHLLRRVRKQETLQEENVYNDLAKDNSSNVH